MARSLHRAAEYAHQQGDDEGHEEDEEQDLRDARGAGGDATETEHGGDQRHDEEHGCPVKHESLLPFVRLQKGVPAWSAVDTRAPPGAAPSSRLSTGAARSPRASR